MGKNDTLFILAGIGAAAYIIPKLLTNRANQDAQTERVDVRQDAQTERVSVRQEEKTERVTERWEGVKAVAETIFSKEKNKPSNSNKGKISVFSPKTTADIISKVVTPNKYTTTPTGKTDYKTVSMLTRIATAEKAAPKKTGEKIVSAAKRLSTVGMASSIGKGISKLIKRVV